jgi:hypothetical protein
MEGRIALTRATEGLVGRSLETRKDKLKQGKVKEYERWTRTEKKTDQ